MSSETPHLRWFQRHDTCICGRKSAGILRGSRNESYGEHCERCANRRLKDSAKVREQEESK